MSIRCAVVVVAALLLAAAPALAQTSECVCSNGGTRDAARTDRCLCTCPTGFARPRCEMENGDQASVRVIFRNVTGKLFVSSQKVAAMKAHFNLANTSDAIRVWKRDIGSEPANQTEINYLFWVRAEFADTIVDDAIRNDAGSQWLVGLDVKLVSSFTVEDAPPGEYARHAIIARFHTSFGELALPSNALIFFIVPLMVIINFPVVENFLSSVVCRGNPEEENADAGETQYDDDGNELPKDSDFAPAGPK